MSLGKSDLFQSLSGDGGGGEEWPDTTFSGDFYREPDDVTRGLTLVSPGDFGDPFGHFGDPSFDKGFNLPGYPGLEQSLFDDKRELQQTGSAATFNETDAPPCLPTDPFFKLEVTSLYVQHQAQNAYQIGNFVFDFFNQEMVSDITKVNSKKYTMKADVFLGSMMSSMKARVYTQDSGLYAIEFQRRSGDAVTFNRTFQMASEYLKPRLTVVSGAVETPAPIQNFGPPPLPGRPCCTADDLTIIFDMARTPGLQAEAASSLAELAAEGSAPLCDSRVFEILVPLLQATSIEVAFPTSLLILHLAQRGEAVSLFAAHGILPLMLAKAQAPTTQAKVSEQLSQALNVISQRPEIAAFPGYSTYQDNLQQVAPLAASSSKTC